MVEAEAGASRRCPAISPGDSPWAARRPEMGVCRGAPRAAPPSSWRNSTGDGRTGLAHSASPTPSALIPSPFSHLRSSEPHHRDASHVYPSSSGHVSHGAARIALWVSDLFNTTSSELRPAVALAEAQRDWRRAEEAAAAVAGADAAAGIVAPPPPSPPPAYGIETRQSAAPRVANATLESATDATPPSPPQPPPPPSPPSPPPLPRLPPYGWRDFVPCETLSDDEWAEMERNASGAGVLREALGRRRSRSRRRDGVAAEVIYVHTSHFTPVLARRSGRGSASSNPQRAADLPSLFSSAHDARRPLALPGVQAPSSGGAPSSAQPSAHYRRAWRRRAADPPSTKPRWRRR